MKSGRLAAMNANYKSKYDEVEKVLYTLPVTTERKFLLSGRQLPEMEEVAALPSY